MNDSGEDIVSLAKKAWSHVDAKADERNERHLQNFFDHLSEDVVFRVSCPKGTPIYGEPFQGKQAVIDYFTKQGPQIIDSNDMEKPPEFVGSGNRVVILGSETFRIKKSGVTVRNKEFAIVNDFRDGLITRVVIIEDLSEFLDAYRDK